MYKKQYKNKPKTKYAKFPDRKKGNGIHKGRAIKKLDVNLFIKKASEENHITPYTSSKSYADFDLTDILKKNILSHGYTNPTQIQEQAIPHLLEGKDVIGISNTGTGKTAAFLIPLINKVYVNRQEKVLIITPTRELAVQIAEEFDSFVKGMNLNLVLCIGGANINRQEKELYRNPQFVVGTPGRIKDLIERKKLHLDRFHTIVLDEVDRMVDIGFIRDIKYFISLLPKNRQSLFFSATISAKVNEILHSFVTNPVTVSVKQQETSENVDQDIIRIKGNNKKIDTLHDLLINKEFDKVLIFGRTKWGVEKLARELVARGFSATAIHGNKTQGQRQRALDQFKRNDVSILLATDVASRGLDIQNVTHVINYDAPESYDDYVHRIGRTGRAGKKGIALTFVE